MVQIQPQVNTITRRGTGSILSGTTSIAITHGLGLTPDASNITVTLTNNPTNTPGAIWVDTIGSTSFTVNCENNPGASNLNFSWSANNGSVGFSGDLVTLSVTVIGPTAGHTDAGMHGTQTITACSVSMNPTGGTYAPGTEVTLTATAGTGFEFYSWDTSTEYAAKEWAETPESSTTVVTVNGNMVIYANFAYKVDHYHTDATSPARNGGIVFTDNYNGDSLVAPYYSKYFIRDETLYTTNYPLIIVQGTSKTVQNCVFDDQNTGTSCLCIMGRGTSNTMSYCTLNNCVTYGFGIDTGTSFTYSYCDANTAQYCFCGSNAGVSCVFDHCTGKNMGLTGIKVKGMEDCTFQYCTFDLTPNNYWTSGQSKYGVDWSDDVAGIHGNSVIYCTFERVSAGTYPTIHTGGVSFDGGVTDSGGNTFDHNTCINLAGSPTMYPIVLLANCDYIVATNNTFTNSGYTDEIVYSTGTHNTLTGNTYS